MTPPIAQYRAQIEAALAHGWDTHAFEDVVTLVESGKAQFWPGPNSVIVTELVTHPRKTTLNFFLAGGNLAELEAMVPKIIEWGKAQGCTGASLVGRRGWERTFLKRQGWKETLVVLETQFDG